MAVEVERLVIALEARLDRYDRNLARATTITNRRASQMERRFAVMSRSLKNSASTAALGVGAAMGGIGAYLGTRQLKAYADGWTTVTRTLAANEEVFGVRLRSAKEMNVLAKDARADLDAYTKLYVRTAAATRDLGASEADVAKSTTTVAKALKLGSASAGEQASVMLQLSQALQKGKLDGDEFRSVMENAGVIQELLAEKLNVSKGAIVRMAAEGKLKVEQLFGALVDGADKVDRIFNRMPTTIGEAQTVLSNSMMEYVGNFDRAHGVTEGVVDALTAVANNMEVTGDSALVLGAALLGLFTPALIARTAAFSMALSANPIGALVAGLAAASAAYKFLADDISYSTENMTTWKDQIDAAVSVIGEEMQPAVDAFGEAWTKAALLASEALTGTGVGLEVLQAVATQVVNHMIGTFVFFGQAVLAAVQHLPSAIGALFVDMANKVTAAVAAMTNEVIGLLNAIPGVEISPVKFQKSLLSVKGGAAELRKALGEAAKSMDRDWLGEISKTHARMKEKIDKTAIMIANGRRLANSTTSAVTRPRGNSRPTTDTGAGGKGGGGNKSFQNAVRQTEERIAALRLENQMIGQNAYELERAKTAQELMNAAKREGIAVTPELLAQIDELSSRYASATTQAQLMKETFDTMKSTASNVLKGFITDLKDGKSGAEALGNSLNKIADMLIDMAVKQLVTSAFGGLGGGGGGLLGGGGMGGGILSLFGFADGGIAAQGRPVPLKKYATGGVANSASIFGEAGPEAAVPLPNGREIPVDLRMPDMKGQRDGGGTAGGEVVVTVQASEQLLVDVDNRAEGVVTRRAPQIVGAAVQATDRALPGMIRKTQKRAL